MAKCGTPKKMMMGGPTATTTSRRAIPTPAPMPARPVPGGVTAVRAPMPAQPYVPAGGPVGGRPMAMKKGGKIDGMAKRGKTKGKMC